jgi:hypothetical protein
MITSRHTRRVLGVAALSVLIGSGAATARPTGGNGVRHVEFGSTSQVVGGDSGCDPTDPSRCAGTYRVVRTLVGDLTGTAYAVGSAVPFADGTYQGQGIAQFTGTVDGCGSGTMLMLESGVLDPSAPRESGTWEIVAGRGTGDLVDTSGSGTADSSAGGSTGTIRCR